MTRLARLVDLGCLGVYLWVACDVVPLAYHVYGFGTALLTGSAFGYAIVSYAEYALKSYAASVAGGPLGGTAT